RLLLPTMPRDLDIICLQCLQKEPHRRYTSAATLAEDLSRFLEGKPIQARPTSLFERSRKLARRHPAAAALVGVGAGAARALVVFGWLLNASLVRERDSFQEALRQERIAAEQREEASRQKALAAEQERLAAEQRLEARRRREQAETGFRLARQS